MQNLSEKWMRISIFLNILIGLFCVSAYSQVTVSGAVSGNGSYTSLRLAFNAINAAAQTNATINITITADTNEGTTSAILNPGTWSRVNIRPSGARTILGNNTNSVIRLNGADNVYINGLNSGGNSLTVENTSTSNNWGLGTILLLNDASYNQIQNCTIKASGTNSFSGAVVVSGGTTTGNDNNEISYCTIMPSGTNLPACGISSNGSSASVANSNLVISNNIIKDCFSATVASEGIYLNTDTDNATITSNKIFQTAERTTAALSSTVYYRFILASTSGNSGHNISNNILGFANEAGTGYSIFSGSSSYSVRGIDVVTSSTAGSTTVSYNTIGGIKNTVNMGSNVSPFVGIITSGYSYNVTNNTIGNTSTTGSVVVSASTAATYTTTLYGIYMQAANSATVSYNNVAGMSYASTADLPSTITAIALLGAGNYTSNYNTVGGSVANSLSAGVSGVTNTSASSIYAINNTSTGATQIMNNNTMRNCSVYTNASGALRPYRVTAAANITVNNNLAESLRMDGTGYFIGIQTAGTGTQVVIQNNTIRGIQLNKGYLTGIQQSGTVSSTLDISGNHLGDTSAVFGTYTTAADNTSVIGIATSTNTTPTNLIRLNNNDFRNVVFTAVSQTTLTFLYNVAQALSMTMDGNTFTNLSLNTAAKSVSLLRNDVSLPASSIYTISNNSVVGTFSKGTSGTVYAYFGGTPTSSNSGQLNINNNNFSNITIGGSTTAYGIYSLDNGYPVKTITSNTFSNWTIGTGQAYIFNLNGFGSVSSVSNNIISNISSQAVLYGMNIGSVATATKLDVAGNAITGLSSTGGSIYGVATNCNASVVNIRNNTFTGYTASAVSTSASGVQVTGGTGTINVYENTFSNFNHAAVTSPSVSGILVSGGTAVNVYKNKITDLTMSGSGANGSVLGLSLIGGTTVTAYNNYIGSLTAPVSNSTNAINGIRCNTSVTSTNNIYNNTIYLNATSTGTNLGVMGIYHRASSTATTGNLVLKNNIIINLSVPMGSGKAIGLYRSATNMENYSADSNNNIFYIGSPSTNRLMFQQGGTTAQTLAAMKTVVTPRESNSFTENVAFASTTSSDTNYLRIADNSVTIADGNALPISVVTTDYDGNTRSTTTPDIGADEFRGQTATVTSVSRNQYCSSAAGQVVTVTGTNMTLVTKVTFVNTSSQEVNATISSATATTLTLATPASIATGNMKVYYNGGVYTSAYTVYNTLAPVTVNGSTTICPAASNATLTLSGLTGTVTRWESAPDATFTGGVVSINNTTSTLTVSGIAATTYYRAVIANGTCGTIYSSNGVVTVNTTTWDGTSWSNGLPVSGTVANILGDLNITADLAVCTMVVDNNAVVTVNPGVDLTITGSLTVADGSVINFTDTANLIQNTNAQNTGTVNVFKNSSPLFLYDYSMWSSPVSGGQTLAQFSPDTNINRFYTFNPLSNAFARANPADTFSTGKGYLIRMPNNWTPYSASNPQPAAWTGTFTGTPNNGNISVPVIDGGTGTTQYNLVGNPYPSPIKISDFLTANAANINGTIWVWRKRNDSRNPVSYSVCTAAGCTFNNGFSYYSDDTLLSKGQGFLVRIKSGVSSIVFNNSMRRSSNVSQFFRQAEKDRYWLSLTDNTGAEYGQMLVAYLPETTTGYDEGYDGVYNNESATFLGSVVQEQELSVEARASFADNDVVPLYFKTDAATTFTIALPKTEGIFAGQHIYLNDKQEGIVRDLTQNSYTFSAEAGNYSNRFEIIYQTSMLGTHTPEAVSDVTVFAKNNTIGVVTSNSVIAKVEVFDLTGRMIYADANINATTYNSKNVSSCQQVLIVQVTDTNNRKTTKKIFL